jgi:topoisomerase-4 subunit B
MPPRQLKETTMNPDSRVLLRVVISSPDDPDPVEEQKEAADMIESLMGKKPELRFAFIQENARFVADLDV